MKGWNKSSGSTGKMPMPKDDDATPNDADDKATAKMAKRKMLASMVAKGGMGMKGPDAC